MFAWLKFAMAFFQPPGLNILLLFCGLYYWFTLKKFRSVFLVIISTGLLYLFSISFCTNKFINSLEHKYQENTFEKIIQNKTPKAIVVLSAGHWPNSNGLLRNLYAAKLANSTKLPILVSGGGLNKNPNTDSEASGMAKSLAADFNISGAIWIESDSKNTLENAKFTKTILEKNNINDVFLVTNGWHMARAIQVFSQQGINVIAAPVLSQLDTHSNNNDNVIMINQFTPSADNLVKSALFFHEYFGAIWYKVLAKVG